MSIFPLPVFEADADPRHREAMNDREIYESLEPPKTIVVRFGAMKLVGEYPYGGDAKPGCGTKLVMRTHRGTEVGEMLTTTCENAGCAKSITRQELLEYIENSGGKDYPFHTNGRILRVATVEDLNKQSAVDREKPQYVKRCRQLIREFHLAMKLVEVEPILGGELLTFYYMSEKRVDFRELVRRLASEFKSRIEMRQVGARDEARLVADYERCGQHCCCKTFLKVLKPVSMKSAKLQKATLDPLKISGRCGRLMCCLRYEDVTYKELKQRLPRKGKRVGTTEGPGVVVDSKILVQLALIRLEHDNREIAVPIEELLDPDTCPAPGETAAKAAAAAEAAEAAEDPLRGMPPEQVEKRVGGGERGKGEGRKRRRRRGRKSKDQQQDDYRAQARREEKRESEGAPAAEGDKPRKKRRRRRGGGGGGGGKGGEGQQQPRPEGERQQGQGGGKRRRRRRRKGGGGSGGGGGGGSDDPG